MEKRGERREERGKGRKGKGKREGKERGERGEKGGGVRIWELWGRGLVGESWRESTCNGFVHKKVDRGEKRVL